MKVRTTRPDLLINHGDGRRITYPLGAEVEVDEEIGNRLLKKKFAERTEEAAEEPSSASPPRSTHKPPAKKDAPGHTA